ncbi:MAG: DUF3597 domain-containing protein, partial [Usitatibacter sp.]
MGFFSKIIDKLRGHSTAQPTQTAGNAQQTQYAPPAGQPGAAPAPQQLRDVDVNAILTDLAKKKGQPSNWQTSIVDTLKLLDLDSSLAARKELAEELHVHAGEHGSAEQNIALQKAVFKKLAENG